MECLVRILLWSSLVTTWTSNHFTLAQSHFPTKFSKKEVFFVNLEEGYFGCQVNETLEVLQIFKIEKLCDGTSDCYLGSDENQKELKCSSKYQFHFRYLCFLSLTVSRKMVSLFTLKLLSMYFKFLVSIKFHAWVIFFSPLWMSSHQSNKSHNTPADKDWIFLIVQPCWSPLIVTTTKNIFSIAT